MSGMPKIALAQVNPTVGDLDENAALVSDWTARAHAGWQVLQASGRPDPRRAGPGCDDLAFEAEVGEQLADLGGAAEWSASAPTSTWQPAR